MKKLNDDQKAAALILMNELAGGKMAHDETITIHIESREISINDFVAKLVPKADVENARKIAREMKEKTNYDLI
jgi:hypothetical protein